MIVRRSQLVSGFSLTITLLLTCSVAFAQLDQTIRFERKFKFTEQAYLVINMKEQGLALVHDVEKFREGQKVFEITRLDTLLKETAVIEVSVQNRMNIIGYEYTPGYLYLLFRTTETESSELVLSEIDLSTNIANRYDIKHEFNMKLTHFTVLERSAIMGGYVAREPAVLLFDIPEAQLKVLPGFFSQDTELLDVRVNQNNTFNTLVTNRSLRVKKSLHLRTFDRNGTQLIDDEIEIDQDHTIISGLTSSLVRDELLIAGTYTVGNNKMPSGYFTVVADPFKDQAIHYYDFPQFVHFLDYMNPKRVDKIKQGARRDREHSKDPEFKTYVSNVKLEEKESGFYLLGECYNATVSSNSSYPYGGMNPYYSAYSGYGYSPFASRYYNSPYSYYNQPIRNEYAVFSASVVAFGGDGDVEWDHSMKLKGERRSGLEQVSDFWCNKNKIVIVTKQEDELWVKSRYKNNEVVSDTLKILRNRPEEVVKDEHEEDGGVRLWYSNKFYVWGYQSVHDSNKSGEERNRNVFYVVKVEAH